MEEYCLIATTTSRNEANLVRDAIENSGHSPMIEHVEVISAGSTVSGYRILVPASIRQAATIALQNILNLNLDLAKSDLEKKLPEPAVGNGAR